MAIYNFEIIGEPVAWQRVKVNHAGFRYVPKKTREAKKEMARQIMAQLKQPPNLATLIKGPVSLTAKIRRSRPKSARTRKYPHVCPDLDNFIKGIMDCMNNVVWVDDAQVVRLFAGKEYATEKHPPGITIMIQELERD